MNIDKNFSVLKLSIGLSAGYEPGSDECHITHETDPTEYDAAWANIRAEFGDFDCRDIHTGEAWQYMGSYLDGDEWIHQFRHRALAGSIGRTYRDYPATEGWAPAPTPYSRPELRAQDLDFFIRTHADGERYYRLAEDQGAELQRFIVKRFGKKELSKKDVRWGRRSDNWWNARYIFDYVKATDPSLTKS